MSIGGSSGKTSSNSTQNSFGYQQSNSYLDPGQAAMQADLYSRLFGGNAPNAGADIASGNTAVGRSLESGLGYGNQGANALSRFINPYNEVAQGQIANLGRNIGDVYRQQILPGISSNFGVAGQRGSSRQGVAEGMAANSVMNQFQQGATDILANSYNQAQQAATGLAGYGQSAANLLSNYQIAGLGAQYRPFEIGAGIVGNPSALTSSWGIDQSNASSRSKGKNASMNVGFSS